MARRLASAGVALAVGVVLGAAPDAGAKAGLITGFGADEYTSSDDSTRNRWFDETVRANAGIVRIDVHWRNVVSKRPDNPRNPADPAYDFSRIDAAVREAQERGLTMVLTVFNAPSWAEAPDPPPDAPAGTWKPNPDEFGDFASALATRYSGLFPDLAGARPLPRVRYFEVWNEPNLSQYITPQWEKRRNGWVQRGPDTYRKLLNSFAAEVRAIHADNLIVAPGTAPYGDAPGGRRMRPLRFLRELLCLNGRLERKRKSCPEVSIDVLSHHPINLSGGPQRSAIHEDDASTPDLGRVRKVLRAASKAGVLSRSKRQPIWVTEFWWPSRFDPGPCCPAITNLSEAKQARYIEQSLYLFWRAGARVAINLEIRDDPGFRTGVFSDDGTPKKAFTAFRFPFVTERRSKSKVLAWGKAAESGTLRIERQSHGEWRPMERLQAEKGEVFTERLRLRGGAKLRASVAGQESLAWKQK